MAEGIYELHWQRREYGELTWQLYHRAEDSQLSVITTGEQAPFETTGDTLRQIVRALTIDGVRRFC